MSGSKTRKPTIAVIGSLNYDLVTRVPRVPHVGETLTAKSFSTNSGGKGANQAVAAARLATRRSRAGGDDDAKSKDGDGGDGVIRDVIVKMVGAVGDDGFGKAMKDEMEKNGVDVQDVRVVQGTSSGIAVIVVDDSTGDNRIMITPGANNTVLPSTLPTWLFDPQTSPDLIILQLEIPSETILHILARATQADPRIPVIFNPAPALPSLLESLYSQPRILILNEVEAKLITRVDFDLDVPEAGVERRRELEKRGQAAVSWFRERGAGDVVITLGADGAYYYDNQSGHQGYFNAYSVPNVLDTTGAGDTFVGAIAVNYVQLKHAEREFCIEGGVSVATKAAAWSVQRAGTWSSMPLADDLLDKSVSS